MPAGRACFLPITYDMYLLGSDAIRCKLDPVKCDLMFFLENVNRASYRNGISSKTAGSTRKRIGLPELKNLGLWVADLSEQKKIGKLFSCVEAKINSLQHKISTLKKYKDGLVQLLLKDTINNWLNGSLQGVKLSHYLTQYKRMTPKNAELSLATLSKDGVSDKTEKYDREFLVKDENKKYRIVELGDLIYNPANLKFNVICINHLRTCLVSPIYETFKILNIDPIILEEIVTSQSFIKYALKFEEGTVYERRSVSPNDLLNIRIKIDKDIAQKMIPVFKKTNNLIKLYDNKLKKISSIKRYLLSALFI